MQDIIFPENSIQIISDILEKNELKEAYDELMKKWRKKEQFHIKLLTDLVIKKTETNLSAAEFADLIKKTLNINAQKAKKIAEDLDEKIFTQIVQKQATRNYPENISIGDILFKK